MRAWRAVGLCAVAAACGGRTGLEAFEPFDGGEGDGPEDTGAPDTEADGPADTSVDTAGDTSFDVARDTGPDVRRDAGFDVRADTSRDAPADTSARDVDASDALP